MIIKADVDNVIALCHIMDDFKEFEKRLTPILLDSNFRYQLGLLSKEKNQSVSSTVYRFYRENKSIIDTINKYSEITSFIDSFYYPDGNPKAFMFYAYEYILSHKDEIDKILAVLQKLKKLGFSEFELNEDFDPSEQIYALFLAYDGNFAIDYVDNAESLYTSNCDMYYITTNSNYVMTLKTLRGEKLLGSKIILNSLLFDPKRLPASLSKKNTYDRILNSKKQQIKESNFFRNSYDLKLCFLVLKNDLESVESAIKEINELDNPKDKEKIIKKVIDIRNDIGKLKEFIEEHYHNVLYQSSSLEQRNLEKRKK